MNVLYLVSKDTKAIMPAQSSYFRTKVLEGNTEKLSVHRAEQIIDNSCIIHGANLIGRKETVKNILNSTSKLPVPISPERGIFMFPTASDKNKDCVWVAFHHVKNYVQKGSKTYIEFYDGTGILVNASEKTIDSQYKRTSQVIVHYNRRMLFGSGKNIW
ncbi:competence protein ComK [Oceanobacillus saliphilus]|uniref:competence protein ComK n=1 Tax=Oceanobacillus saliphilus TaxID=2925834 RepID=UPI00201D9355|nr:competence protein ComK [Oceanobacillus saliphilus]